MAHHLIPENALVLSENEKVLLAQEIIKEKHPGFQSAPGTLSMSLEYNDTLPPFVKASGVDRNTGEYVMASKSVVYLQLL